MSCDPLAAKTDKYGMEIQQSTNWTTVPLASKNVQPQYTVMKKKLL